MAPHEKSSYTIVSGKSQGAPAARYACFRTNSKEHFSLKSFARVAGDMRARCARRELNYQNFRFC